MSKIYCGNGGVSPACDNLIGNEEDIIEGEDYYIADVENSFLRGGVVVSETSSEIVCPYCYEEITAIKIEEAR